MSEWKKVKLKNICSDIIDCVNKTAPVCDYETPYKMLRTSDIRNGQINTEGLKCVSKETFEKWNRRGYLQKGDVIFTREAPVGEVGWLKDPKNLFLGQRLMFFRADNKKCDNRFLFYSLFFSDNKRNIIAKSNGSTVNHLRVPDCENIEIYIPDLHTQQNIAIILSRYDSLIENYQKQIKLLEEAAQRLYKEWFVDLHFPGHENTKIVNGVPEGWEKKSVDSIYSIKYGKNLSTKLIKADGDYPVYGANGVIGYYDKANCNEQVVLITSRGNGSGDVLMTYHKNAFITNNSFIVIPLNEYDYCQLPFTYQFLKNANFRSVRTGAAQPQLTNQSIHTVDVVLPQKELIVEYCKRTQMSNDISIHLRDKIRLLTEARDRLLPKLMSGEIEV